MADIISVTNQLTQRLIRSSTTTYENLLYTPKLTLVPGVYDIVRVGLTADDDIYTQNIHYQISGSTIVWVSGGPSVGQVYYVTYGYNPTQFLKDFATIVSELETDFLTMLPSLDIFKSETRNMLINVLGRQFTDLYNSIQRIYDIQSLTNLDQITDQELANYGANFGLTVLGAEKASGYAKFYVNTAPVTPITVISGSRVTSNPDPTTGAISSFVTTQSGTITAPDTYVILPIEAETSGSAGNVKAESIRVLSSTVLVDGVINLVPTTGGRDQESKADFSQRIKDVFVGRNIATIDGLKQYVLSINNVIDAYIADVGDPKMERDLGVGCKADIYIQSESGYEGTVTDPEYTFTSAGAGQFYVLGLQPSTKLVSDLINPTDIIVQYNPGTGYVTLTPGTDYTFIKDTSTLKKSTRSSDKIQIKPSVSIGHKLLVTYTYDQLINTIQTNVDDDTRHVAGIDVLIREAESVSINVTASIKLATGYKWDDVRTSVITNVSNYIESKEIGSSILYGEVINIVHDTPGVEDLLPLTVLDINPGTDAETIALTGNQYPRAGTITINQIS